MKNYDCSKLFFFCLLLLQGEERESLKFNVKILLKRSERADGEIRQVKCNQTDLDSSSSGSAIDKSQLPKAAPFSNGCDVVIVHIYLQSSSSCLFSMSETKYSTKTPVALMSACTTSSPCTKLHKFTKPVPSWPTVIIATLRCVCLFVCFSHDTLRELMTMHHHTKFGYKRLSGSEDVFWSKHRQTNTLIQ